jgi:nitrous oxidase accessory protein NosD
MAALLPIIHQALSPYIATAPEAATLLDSPQIQLIKMAVARLAFLAQ